MRAAVMRKHTLVVDDVADPVPGEGQVLARVLACGICGSDLHFLKYGREMVALQQELAPGGAGMSGLDLDRDDVIMGHEFCCEVVALGPGATGVQEGDRVVSMPVIVESGSFTDPANIVARAIGYSKTYPGAYSEFVILMSMLALKVPNGLDHRLAALTEPMAVGWHAVEKSGIKPGDAALVLGAGPVGLAVIAGLKLKGIEPIVAADFSPKRRALATTMGAHEVTDPRDDPAVDVWQRVDGKRPLVVFEAVGTRGMIDRAMRDAPRGSRILVVGVCMEEDAMRPMIGIGKELNIQFALGYDPFEFASTLRNIAEGRLDVAPLITGSVTIDGVPQAFADLANPDAHAKILVEPATRS
jgi:threonine dehydrogenase-like Zn-dependent dehydrogenase